MFAFKPDLQSLMKPRPNQYDIETIQQKAREILSENDNLTRKQLAEKLAINEKTFQAMLRRDKVLAEICGYKRKSSSNEVNIYKPSQMSKDDMNDIKKQIRTLAAEDPYISKSELSHAIGVTRKHLMRILRQNEDLLCLFHFLPEEDRGASKKVHSTEALDAFKERIREMIDMNPNLTRNQIASELGITKQIMVRLSTYYTLITLRTLCLRLPTSNRTKSSLSL